VDNSNLPVLLPVVPMVAAVLSVLVGLWRPVAAHVVAVVGALSALGLAVTGLATVVDGPVLRHELGGWPPPVGIEYVLDPLSAFMAVIVTGIGLLALVYPVKAGFYVTPGRGYPLHGLVLLLLTGLLGVVVSGDLFHLFVMLEIFAISTYALVALGGDRAVFASFRYLLIGTAGSGLYLLGVGFIYFSTGSLNMADVAALLPDLADSPTIVGSAVLITVGLAIKMALFPLHVWLPDAHTSAPPAVAALLAAVQVKIGAYALVRILYGVYGAEFVAGDLPIALALTWFGAAGVVVGSVMAIAQRDFKRMLAYSTVAQLGYIGVGIGLAEPLALVAALLHILAHAVMKSCLFFIAGGIYAQTGVREVPGFAGLGRRMPLLMGAFAVAAASMVGIPPTLGFFSKLYLVVASVEAGWWPLAVLIVGSSLLTATYMLRVIEQVFTQEPVEPAVADAGEAGMGVLAPVGLLAAVMLVVGVANVALVNGVLDPVAAALLGA
jgi:multicomponent Na+:H+ antiporter subunit D